MYRLQKYAKKPKAPRTTLLTYTFFTQKKQKIPAFPAPDTDYQSLAKIFLHLNLHLSPHFPHPTVNLTVLN